MDARQRADGLAACGCELVSVLLLDDEPGFRTSLAGALRDDGHPVRDFGAASEIPDLALLYDVTVVVADYELPGLNGLRFSDRFRALHSDVPIVIVATSPDAWLTDAVADRAGVSLVGKPVPYTELHALIHVVSGTRDRTAR